MSEKINIKELESMVANIVNELGISEVFNEEMNKQIQEKIKHQISGDKEIVKEDEAGAEDDTEIDGLETDDLGSDMPNLSAIPADAQIIARRLPGDKDDNGMPIPAIMPPPHIEAAALTTEPIAEPQLPSFIEKAEPAQVFVFDQNELSLGGENMANKTFRLMSNPDEKKSMHEMWIEEGKIRADVYIVKFEKLGEIKFNPFNTTARLEEKKFDPDLNNIAQPFNENPFEPQVDTSSLETQDPAQTVETPLVADNELEAKIYDIVTKMIKGMTVHSATGPVGVNIDAISAGQIKNPEPAPTDTLGAIMSPVMENSLKMNDLIKDSEFMKVNTPEELIEGINGKSSKAKLINKNDEVQSWLLEGQTFHLPATIISARKCYISKKTI